jgi:hypothetical protein
MITKIRSHVSTPEFLSENPYAIETIKFSEYPRSTFNFQNPDDMKEVPVVEKPLVSLRDFEGLQPSLKASTDHRSTSDAIGSLVCSEVVR